MLEDELVVVVGASSVSAYDEKMCVCGEGIWESHNFYDCVKCRVFDCERVVAH